MRVIDSLERNTLVMCKRAEKDRYRVTVCLTVSGRELIAWVFLSHAEIVVKAFLCLSVEEKDI
ncbi:hypothetical protein LA52FAK_07630 [Desulforhopalus sp. 52FAK]